MPQWPSLDPSGETDFFLPDFAPVPMQRRRAKGWTPENQQLFIAMLAETGSVTVAARCIGLSARSAYKLREKEGAEGFAMVWEEALEIGVSQARDLILERWRNGRLAPRWYRGKIVGYSEKFNDRALIAALLSYRREAAAGPSRQESMRQRTITTTEYTDQWACDAPPPSPIKTAESLDKNKENRSPRLHFL